MFKISTQILAFYNSCLYNFKEYTYFFLMIKVMDVHCKKKIILKEKNKNHA